MKILKRHRAALLLTALFLLAGTRANSQVCGDYFPMKEGTVLTYMNYDKKGKATGGSEMSLKEKSPTAGGTSIVFSTSFSDDKGETLYNSEVEMECIDGVLYIDAGKLLDPATLSAYETMEVAVSGENLEMPLGAAPGTALNDGSVEAVISSGGLKILTISVNVTNRKIEGRETVETPAGSFKCVKYSYDALTQMGFVKVNVSGIEWYSHEYGTVRSESYDKKGKLSGYTLLESVSN